MPASEATASDQVDNGPRVENTIPVLPVSDLAAGIRFYCDVLGFKIDWSGSEGQIASVSRDGHCIMLRRHDTVMPGCVWIGGSLLISLWHHIRAKGGVTVIEKPTNQRWALEMKILDPDGNVLWFGNEPLKDVPFGVELTDAQLHRAAEG